MMQAANAAALPVNVSTRERLRWARVAKVAGIATAVAIVAVLAFARLTEYPAIWFDEGIHLHVPKAVVLLGAYADYSSDGLRYYGPTMSVGPTVMLPIALVFKTAGIGLLQARLVIVAYLLCAMLLAWRLGRLLGGTALATVAMALLVTSRGVDFVTYGRQVLGEVPAFAFLLGGLCCWFAAWEKPRWWTLVASGLLFGLAVVTKYQFVIALGPGLVLCWALEVVYYRRLPHRVYLVPLVAMTATFVAWQAVAVLYLGPSLAAENLTTMRKAAADAALTFSPARMWRAFREVVKPSVYSGLLLPALAYAVVRGRERSLASQRWTAIGCLAAANLGWFVLASIGWPRYAFVAFALGAFFVARPVVEVAAGTVVLPAWLRPYRRAAGVAAAAALLVTVLLPLGMTLREMAGAPHDQAKAMAEYVDAHVRPDALIETWDPEMGFFTNHRYHYPPATLLMKAVGAAEGGRAPADVYDFRAGGLPDYVLEGPFAKLVGVYPPARLEGVYIPRASTRGYTLYERLP